MSDLFKTLLIDRPRVYGTDGAGLLEEANNLSDVADVTTARSNLGVYSTGETNTRLNALAPRQGVAIPAANSISTVSVLALGTSDFSVTLPPLMLSDYTISDTDAANLLFESHTAGNNRVRVGLRATGGVWRITFTDGAAADTTYDITPTRALVDGLRYAIALTFDRDGLATLYVDGQANGTVDISAAAAIDIGSGNTNLARWLGGTATAGTLFNAVVHNFALPATTTSGVVGVAERYASGVWVQPSERSTAVVGNVYTGDFTASADGFSNVNAFDQTFDGSDGWNRVDSTGATRFSSKTLAPEFGKLYRVRFSAGRSGAVASLGVYFNGSPTTSFTLPNPNTAYNIEVYVLGGGVTTFTFQSNPSAGESFYFKDVVVDLVGSTLDLTPIGVGRVLIDRSASRNHAIVSGTVHPTYLQPAESGRIIATTNLATNQQLLALSAFDAANKYRITSWTVTSTGTPTISLGNASAGTEYVNGLTLVANTPTAVTLATSIAATANLWCNSDTTDPVTHVITYERIS
jgi:hypothetical protein